MTANIANTVAYLRTTRQFPDDLPGLLQELNKAYIDTANCVNSRTIGIFNTVKPAVTGEGWFITGNKQQTFRQLYTFTDADNVPPISLPHGINIAEIGGFTRIYGTFTDGTLWYPLPFVDETDANNQVSVKVDSSNIIITEGATAPTITKGFCVLEWLSIK